MKLNTSLLNDLIYVQTINEVIDNSIVENRRCSNKVLICYPTKMNIHGASISYATFKDNIFIAPPKHMQSYGIAVFLINKV